MLEGWEAKLKTERKPTANHIPEKGFVSKYIKNSQNSTVRKQPN